MGIILPNFRTNMSFIKFNLISASLLSISTINWMGRTQCRWGEKREKAKIAINIVGLISRPCECWHFNYLKKKKREKN